MSREGSPDGVGPSPMSAWRAVQRSTSLPQSSASASSGASESGPGPGWSLARSPALTLTSVGDDAIEEVEEPLITFRFEHREDDNGHHVVIGREGKLSRCEVEIRTYVHLFCVLPHGGHTELIRRSYAPSLSAHQNSRCRSGIRCARFRTAKFRRRQTPRAPSLGQLDRAPGTLAALLVLFGLFH